MYNIEENNTIVEEISGNIIKCINYKNSDFGNISLLYKLKNDLKEKLRSLYKEDFNKKDFDDVFEKNEVELIKLLDCNGNCRSNLERKLSTNLTNSKKINIKNYIKIFFIKNLKQHEKEFYRIDFLYSYIIAKRRKSTLDQVFLKDIKRILKRQKINFYKFINIAVKIPLINDGEFLIKRAANFILLSIPALISGLFSVTAVIVLYLFSKFDNFFSNVESALKKYNENIYGAIINESSYVNDNIPQDILNKKRYKYNKITFYLVNKINKINNFLLFSNKLIANVFNKIISSFILLFSFFPSYFFKKFKLNKFINSSKNDILFKRNLSFLHKKIVRIKKINKNTGKKYIKVNRIDFKEDSIFKTNTEAIFNAICKNIRIAIYNINRKKIQAKLKIYKNCKIVDFNYIK